MKKILFVFAVAILAAFARPASVHAQTAAAPPTVLSAIGDNSDFGAFAAYTRLPNLAATFRAAGTYTVLVPHNVIFRNMPFSKLDSLNGDTARLAKLVKTHTIKGRLAKTDIDKKLTLGKGKFAVKNLLGDPLIFSLTSDSRLLITDKNGKQLRVVQFDMNDAKGVGIGVDGLLIDP